MDMSAGKTYCFFTAFLSIVFLFIFGTSGFSQTDTIKIKSLKTTYDTVTVRDTVIIYDTIWTNPIFSEINLGVSGSLFFNKWRNFNSEVISLLNQKNYRFGIQSDFAIKRFAISPGIYFSSFLQSAKFGFSYEEIDSLINTEIVTESFYVPDSTGPFWEYQTWTEWVFDSIANDSTLITFIDSVSYYLADSTLVTTTDTIFTTEYDTLKVDTSALRNISYKYLEVPLILRYTFYQGKKFELDAAIGFVAGLLIKTESYYFNSGIILQHNKDDCYKFLPSLWFSLALDYHLTKDWLIRLEPYYNPGIRSVYKTETSITKIPDRYGLRFGVLWKF
jgi:hypothetical protein